MIITDNFAPRVFWGWNNVITDEEVERQLCDLKEKGIAGVFVHARAGLITPYMGEEWMNAFAKTVQVCEKIGLEVWIYDEYGWPSGFGGGKVYERSEQFKEKYLEGKYCREADLGEDREKIYAAYAFRNGKFTLVSDPREDEAYFFALKRVNDYYVDITDREAIDCFIEVTHEQYKKRFLQYFGKTIKGVFTDEPHLSPRGMPFGKYICEEFLAENGYPLRDAVPYVLFDRGEYAEYRYAFWRTVNRLFTGNFVKKYNDWCKENGLIMTGHFACEEGLVDQIPVCGGLMPLYEKEGMIGIDALGNRFVPAHAYKMAESVAFQTGKREILCETYAGSGYDCSFRELLAIWAYQAAFGVNVPCLSISMYSLVGNRKRDYPQFFSYQMPFWEKANVLFGEMAAVNARLSKGERTPSILVVYPKTSAWQESGYDGRSRIMDISAEFRNLTESLIDLQADFDFGDEGFLQANATVDGKTIVVGKGRYSAIVLPKMIQIDDATLKIVNEFAKNGGTILNFNADRVAVDCGKSGYEKMPGEFVVNRKDYLRKTLDVMHLNDDARFLEADGRKACSGLVIARRKHKERIDLFAFHKARGERLKTTLCTRGRNKITATYCGGKERVLPSFYDSLNDKTFTETEFFPLQYAFFKVEKEKTSFAEKGSSFDGICEKRYLDAAFGEADYENCLTIDKVCYSIDGGAFSEERYFIKANADFYRKINGKGKDVLLTLKYTFFSEGLPKNVLLGAEADGAKVFVNGTECSRNGYLIDQGIARYEIGGLVVSGKNEIVIEKTIERFYNPLFDRDVFQSITNVSSFPYCIESVYLFGDFSVRSETLCKSKNCVFAQGFSLTERASVTGLSDLTERGLPFFSGKLQSIARFSIARTGGERVFFGIDELDAIVAEAELNGKRFDVTASYDKTDITDDLVCGENVLKLTLYAGLRNLFGPHHHVYGKHYYTGPSVFEGVKEWQDVVVYPELSENTYREEYSFVPFGAKGIYIEKIKQE